MEKLQLVVSILVVILLLVPTIFCVIDFLKNLKDVRCLKLAKECLEQRDAIKKCVNEDIGEMLRSGEWTEADLRRLQAKVFNM